MDELRIALLAVGIVVIAGVYVRERLRDRRTRTGARTEPVFDEDTPAEAAAEMPVLAEPVSETPPEEAKADGEPGAAEAQAPQPAGWADLVVVHVRSRGAPFSGAALAAAFEALGLGYGPMDIYHRRDDRGRILYSVANAREPGTFPAGDLDGFETPALTLFLTLPGHPDAAAGVEALLAGADFLAERVGGELLDRDRQPLDEAGRTLLRARAAEAG